MAQKLYPKNFGMIEVERSWQDGSFHIAKLTNGAYCHISGLPVKEEAELRAVLTGETLNQALDWFRHRHEMEENPPRRIMFEADGTPMFEDGTPVDSPSDLYESLKPGPLLDAALIGLVRKMDRQKEVEAMTETPAGIIAEEMKAGKVVVPPRKPPPKGGGRPKQQAKR